MNKSAIGFCCNTGFFSLIISNNLTEVGLGLENKIIQINLSHKKCFDKKTKQMKGISNIHDRLYLNTTKKFYFIKH